MSSVEQAKPFSDGVSESESIAKWYLVKVYAGQEFSVAERMRKKSLQKNAEPFYLNDVLVPIKRYITVKDGKETILNKAVWPGYIFVKLVFDEGARAVIRSVRGVFDFIGGAFPSEISGSEVEAISEIGNEKTDAYISAINFKEGEDVMIVTGPLAKTHAKVVEILPGKKVKVEVSIFGRRNLVDLNWDQVESE